MKRTVSGDMMIDDIGEDESSLLVTSRNTQSNDSQPSPDTNPVEPAKQPSHPTNTPSVSSATVTESTGDIAETTLAGTDPTMSINSEIPLIASSHAADEIMEMEMDVFEEEKQREKNQRRKLKSVLKKTPLTPVIQQHPGTGSTGSTEVKLKRTHSPTGTKRQCCVVS